jgi:hypothetical protein
MDRDSTQYAQIPVHTDTDPTGHPVRVALLPAGQHPTPADWHPATWTTIGGVPHAQLLIGPAGGALTLTPGTWQPWLDIGTGQPHRPDAVLLVT